MPASLARSLREHASKRGMTTSELVRQAVAAFLATKRQSPRTEQAELFDGSPDGSIGSQYRHE
jgi:hypothetical protein